jgi:homoserine dehydrogenase
MKVAPGPPPAGGSRDIHGGATARRGPRTVRVCLLGFGHVARAFCELLARQEAVLAQRHGLRVLVSAVGTRHGSLLAPQGLTPAAVLETVGRAPASPGPHRPAAELLGASGADVLVELTVMEKDFAPQATGHIEVAFALGMDVVTANKGPLAWNWRRVAAAAADAGRRVRFESTVMDGLPVFSLLELTLPDCRLLGFEAVFNATTNFIIDAMAGGRSFAEGLAHAQAEGYAEADPAHDIDGWDAACKAAALANVAMDAGITPADVERQSLRDVPHERIAAARAAGRRLRLVTTVWREERAAFAAAGRVRARVRAEELDIDHPLASLSGESLGAVLHTDLMADVVVCERHALVPQTAYGVYADLLHLCRTV